MKCLTCLVSPTLCSLARFMLGLACVTQPRLPPAEPRMRHAEPSLRHAASPASHSLACVVPGYDRVCVTLR